MARTKGTKQLNAEMSAALFDEFKQFCADRGETVRHHLELALRRHMDNPPPPPAPVSLPPLPPVTVPDAPRVDEKPAPKKKGAKK
jgi:hypothetical protein